MAVEIVGKSEGVRWQKSNTLNIMQEAIDTLHFHPQWFEPDLLPSAFFEQQIERFKNWQRDDDGWQSLEHHRYLAFKTVLASHERLSDEQIAQYIELCQLDEDQMMASSALRDLLLWRGLAAEQYENIIAHPAFDEPHLQKTIWRNKMSRELELDSVSAAAFTEIRERRDTVFERSLVQSSSISRQQLEVLAETGISRAVRNIAKNRLGRKP